MKVFKETGYMEQSAHFGWQNKDSALYGLREGYKNSADTLVEYVLEHGENPKILDTYVFPILFSYRHCIEISLKHIYRRAPGKMPPGGHNLLILWENVKNEIIDQMICSEEFLEHVKGYKENYIHYSLEGIKLTEIKAMLKEIQEANQRIEEINPSNKQIDQNAEVWRYLISTDENLFFSCGHSIDYLVLKESMNHIYEILDYLYYIVDEYLSS